MTSNTWNGISSCAKSAGAKFPELVAAQWALESGFGRHVSGINNYFGLKGYKGSFIETKEYVDGWRTIKDRFMNFPSIESCVKYLVARWYKDWGPYFGVNNAPNREESARMLQSEGYATDPNYANKLIRLMNEHAPYAVAPPIRLRNAAKYYEDESHQVAAWNWLEEELSPDQLEEFALMYRSGPAKPKFSNPLSVPYYSQHDNSSGRGYRECFSSTCAMVAAYHGKVRGDDEYNLIRSKFGDTTDSNAQVQALRSLGLKARFTTIMNEQMLKEEIDAGRPVACGWLHHGPLSSPSGGGHWSVVIGYDSEGYVLNDPYGKANLINGNYSDFSSGRYVHYDRDSWVPRWRVKGSGGWSILVSR